MTPILDRIRAHGGEAVRTGWRLSLRRGRLTPEAMEWIAQNRDALMREMWPDYDAWEERAAIREFCGGADREAANDAAYAEITGNA